MDPVLRDPEPIPTSPPVVTSVMPEPAPADIQPLRWGPIWAGLLTAVGLFFLLTLVAVTLGLQAAPGVDPGDEEEVGFVAVLATSAIALVSFFVGGFVASWSAGLADQGRSLLNGFLVWALWLVAVIVLAVLGLGSFVGAAGEVFGRVDPTIEPAIEGQALVDLAREGAWQTLLVLLLTASAAALGGVVGARPELRGVWSRVVVVRPRV
jgi:hypothetical protein